LEEAGKPKFLSSPRTRRRLGWLTGVLALGGVIALLVVLLPGRPPEDNTLSPGGYTPPKPAKRMHRSNDQLVDPIQVAAQFIGTAVTRKNVDKSWDLLSPTYAGRGEYTREEWAKGDHAKGGEGIPVVEYPADRARWKLDYSLKNEVGLKVALWPKPGDDTPATVFDIALVRYGKGKHARWLVDYFSPAGSRTIPTGSGGGGGGGRSAAGFPDLNPKNSGAHRLDTIWLAVPIGILGLAILLPIAFGIGYLIRVKRAEREFAATSRS
jgi:hypothetical protein